MDVEYKFLCDHAQEAGGKLHALGVGIDNIYAQQVPATHPHMGLVVGLRYSRAESGQKQLRVNLITSDGVEVIDPIEGPMAFPEPASGVEGLANILLDMNQLTFPEYGAYAFHVTVNGNEVARLPLTVSRPPTSS